MHTNYIPFILLLKQREIVGVGDRRKRGRPANAPGALAGPKTFSITNNPNSIIREKVVLDNIAGSIVAHGNKVWFVRFPTLPDDNGDPTVKSFSAAKV